ncbi:MAG TPA: ComF family protein [Acidobacteriota bacterium]|nr:ComF family protein [Acidobacteriota bacterium]
MIHGLKFQGRRNIAGLLASLMADLFSDSWRRDDFDYIVPVPLHPRRHRERGFNQSELLARHLSRLVDVPVYRALRKIRATPPQVGLTDARRRENVRNVFLCIKPARIIGRRILLVDDVMTTGATVSSATRALLRSGCARVSVMTAARSVRE